MCAQRNSAKRMLTSICCHIGSGSSFYYLDRLSAQPLAGRAAALVQQRVSLPAEGSIPEACTSAGASLVFAEGSFPEAFLSLHEASEIFIDEKF